MIFGNTILNIITYVRGGETTSKIKDAAEGMEALSELARNGQKTEKVISKLNKGSITAQICSSCLTKLKEDVEA